MKLVGIGGNFLTVKPVLGWGHCMSPTPKGDSWHVCTTDAENKKINSSVG